MAISPQATVVIDTQAGLLSSSGGDGTQDSKVLIDISFASGTGVQQITTPFDSTRTLGAGANEDLDLQALLDKNGDALNLTGVRLIVVQADQANGDDIRLAPAGANGWDAWIAVGSLMDVEAGGTVLGLSPRAASPYFVDATHRLFNVLNLDGASSIIYTVTIYGF